MNFKIQNLKFKIIESKAGTYFVRRHTKKNQAEFGVERTGHYYFKNFFYSDSGILAAIEVINATSCIPYSLSDFSNLLPQYFRSPELNFKISAEGGSASGGKNNNAGNLFRGIEKRYKKTAQRISKLDGLTMEFNPPTGGWRFNLRPSNTEPLIRLNIESTTKKILPQKIREFQRMLTG